MQNGYRTMNIMEDRRTAGRLAPLVQAGLAALVAGSLLSFSAIAFNDGFTSTTPERGVAASPLETQDGRPVVVPGDLGLTGPGGDADLVAEVPDERAAPTADSEVLGTQIDRKGSDPDGQDRGAITGPGRDGGDGPDGGWMSPDPQPGQTRETHDGSSAWGSPRDGHGNGRGNGSPSNDDGKSGGRQEKPEKPEAKPRDEDDEVESRDDDDDDEGSGGSGSSGTYKAANASGYSGGSAGSTGVSRADQGSMGHTGTGSEGHSGGSAGSNGGSNSH